jgi:septum formation protein
MQNSAVYLASSSPRRHELLAQLGIEFTVVLAEIDETPQANEAPLAYLVRMAEHKAEAAAIKIDVNDDDWIIAGDTSLVLDGEILGKPNDANHAKSMLSQLSGRGHQVYSSIAVWHQGKVQSSVNITEVSFAEIEEDEIAAYVASGEPMDKAGAYAIQGQAARWVKNINGSYSGVMGLPLYELSQLLKQNGFHLRF